MQHNGHRPARRIVAGATVVALASSALAVPAPDAAPSAHAQVATEGGFLLGASANDTPGRRGWTGQIRLAADEHEPRTVRSVRMFCDPRRCGRKEFPEQGNYNVTLIRGSEVLEDFGTLPGYGFKDGEGNRWLDIDLPRDAKIIDDSVLMLRKPDAFNDMPVRNWWPDDVPYALGYTTARYQPVTLAGSVAGLPAGSKVAVRATDEATGKHFTQDATGPYSLSLRAGSYTVQLVNVPAGYTVPSPRRVTVEPGGTARADFAIAARDVNATIAVRNDANQPVPAATVDLARGGEVIASATADDQGTVIFTGLAPGVAYEASVKGTGGYSGGSAALNPKVGKDASATVHVGSLNEISGTVVDDHGALAGAKVTLGGKASRTATAGSDGTFHFEGLPAGSYTVTVPATGTHGSDSQTVDLVAGKRADPVRLTAPLIRGGVAATVTGSVAPSAVTIFGGGLATPAPLTRSGASYTASDLLPGTYTVAAEAPRGYAASGPATVTVAPKATATAALSISPLDGSVTGRIVDGAGAPVAGASVALVAKDGTRTQLPVRADGTFSSTAVKPGDYTVSATVPGTYTAPKDRQITVKPGDAVALGELLASRIVVAPTPKPTPTTSAKPAPDDFAWERVEVAPGEVSVTSPSRKSGAGQAQFEKVSVTQVSGAGGAVPADSWVAVQKDGTLVATPPRGMAPGEYTLEVVATTGERDTVTIVVTQAPTMAERYTVTYPAVGAPAGMASQSGAPRASVTEAGFVYPDRALPEGTTFTLHNPSDPAAAAVTAIDGEGRLTLTVPANAAKGTHTVAIDIAYPDGSRGTAKATYEVRDALLADLAQIGLETGLKVVRGDSVTILRSDDTVLPEGTTFALSNGAKLGGWGATVNASTGAVRVTAPADGTSGIVIPLTAFFPDGSSKSLQTRVGVAEPGSQAARTNPGYEDVRGTRGTHATVGVTGGVPAGATFEVVDDGGLPVAVDTYSGVLRVDVPKDAPLDAIYKVLVRVRYADGSTKEVPILVSAVSDASRHTVDFTGAHTPVGGNSTQRPAAGLPDGTRFSVPETFKQPGWSATVNPTTGELAVGPSASVPVGQSIAVPVDVTYPDGSTARVEVPFTAAEQEAPVKSQGSSANLDWLVILLGALAALVGAGYAAWLNQDRIAGALQERGIAI
ncbi:Rib/alpha-like domain-containing protein [Corynebacterium jeddahense]|uniref:Cna protein B-type domain protein n=1 Tax=Corynebacterium jeddahense TaxID=1414719 RepID=A0ABY7UIW4_9CORY|nr:Rib/alpha-like domain-containing protein [Corynebacterium jeddahense]WCZ38397.1 Cna protein B-type domain protein [Corynebacterium jeddahense]